MTLNRVEKYMTIVSLGLSKSGLTKRWQVTGIGAVGFIGWDGAWRRYTFEPLDGTRFDEDGLTLIADFIRKENRGRRTSKKPLKT